MLVESERGVRVSERVCVRASMCVRECVCVCVVCVCE